jgi:hypothetical protein
LLPNTASSETVNGITFTVNSDGSVTANGTATAISVLYIATGTWNSPKDIILSGCPSGGSSNKYNQFVQISGGSTLGTDIGNGVTFTLTEDATVIVYSPRVVSGTTVTGLKFYPMLTLATETDQTYEPYCGGTPSPNPSYPQVIENYADCVEMEQGAWAMSSGGIISGDTYICSKHTIPCKAGDVVNLICDDMENYRLAYFNESGMTSTSTLITSGNSITIPSDGTTHFAFNLINSNGISPQTVGKIQLTVNGKNVGQIVEHGKNFVKYSRPTNTTKNGITITYNEDGSITLNGTCTEWFFVNINYVGDVKTLPSGKYRLVNTQTKGVYFCMYANGLKVNTDSYYDFNFEITDNTIRDYLRYEVAKGTTLNNVTIYPLIVRENETDLTYEPYTEKITTFFLTEPLRATDRIVRVDGVWYEEHNRKTVVFDGSEDENWIYVEGSTVPYRIVINDMNTISSNITKLKCTHYQTVGVLDTWLNYDYLVSGYSIGGVVQSVVFRDISISTFDEFKAKLQASPITVEYELATPTLTPLDTASQLALNDMVTFDGVTYIEVDSKVKPSGIRGEYGTSQVGAYTLKCMNDNDTDRVERAELKARLDELAVALVSQ